MRTFIVIRSSLPKIAGENNQHVPESISSWSSFPKRIFPARECKSSTLFVCCSCSPCFRLIRESSSFEKSFPHSTLERLSILYSCSRPSFFFLSTLGFNQHSNTILRKHKEFLFNLKIYLALLSMVLHIRQYRLGFSSYKKSRWFFSSFSDESS